MFLKQFSGWPRVVTTVLCWKSHQICIDKTGYYT